MCGSLESKLRTPGPAGKCTAGSASVWAGASFFRNQLGWVEYEDRVARRVRRRALAHFLSGSFESLDLGAAFLISASGDDEDVPRKRW